MSTKNLKKISDLFYSLSGWDLKVLAVVRSAYEIDMASPSLTPQMKVATKLTNQID